MPESVWSQTVVSRHVVLLLFRENLAYDVGGRHPDKVSLEELDNYTSLKSINSK